MFETVVNAGTALYNAMNAVFSALMYAGESQIGFYDVIANGDFNISFIQLILGAVSASGLGVLYSWIKRLFSGS